MPMWPLATRAAIGTSKTACAWAMCVCSMEGESTGRLPDAMGGWEASLGALGKTNVPLSCPFWAGKHNTLQVQLLQ